MPADPAGCIINIRSAALLPEAVNQDRELHFVYACADEERAFPLKLSLVRNARIVPDNDLVLVVQPQADAAGGGAADGLDHRSRSGLGRLRLDRLVLVTGLWNRLTLGLTR